MTEAVPHRVSVVIPALNAAGVVAAAITSALAQPDVSEVVIAAGDAGTAAASRAVDDPRVVVVDNASGSTPDALNAAIAASTGDVIVRLDAHTQLDHGYVATALRVLDDTGAANVGGRQVPHAERGFAAAVAAAMTSPAGAGGAAYRTGRRAGPVDTVYLGVFRRSTLKAVGGFDPRFVRNQDAELNMRLRRAGHIVWFTPELAVRYLPRGDVASLARQYFGYGRWRRLTARVHRGSLAPRQLAPPLLVVGLAAAATASVSRSSPWPLQLVGGGYAATMLGAGVHAAPRLALAPATAVALIAMHLSWGLGFLVGPPRGAAGSGESPAGSGDPAAGSGDPAADCGGHGAGTCEDPGMARGGDHG